MVTAMRKGILVVLAWMATIALAACGTTTPSSGEPAKSLILATTTSTQDSGLLDELLPVFTRESGWQVKTVAVGSGAAIELGRRGEADVLLVHSPAAEEKFVAEGGAGQRRLVMHNDFVLVGPPDDPAKTKGASSTDALKKIADAKAVFVSRGDESGTHSKEKDLWSKAALTPGGSWYQSTGQGMGETLRVASEKGGYTLSDRATYLAQRDTLQLEVLSEGDPGLLNVYHVIEMTTKAGDKVQPDGAKAFADWLVAEPAQRLIGEFGRAEYGRPLFTPDAGVDESTLGL